MKTFRIGGIHPAPDKITAGKLIVAFAPSGQLRILLSQSIGAPAKPVVKAGDTVLPGMMIAEAGGFVSAPVHSPCAGTVAKIEKIRNTKGLWQEAIIINVDEQADQNVPERPRTPEEIEALTADRLIGIISDAGIVGLGGATFPTRVKLSVPEGKKAEYIIINGAECEPYLTCDDAIMRIHATEIIRGAELLKRASGAEHIIVGIEANKPEAIDAMRQAAAQYAGVDVVKLKMKYPQGSEKQLIDSLTGRRVPPGKLPIDVGCIVDNVATAFAVYEAVYLGKPLTHRVLTVTGPEVADAGNFLVPFGLSLASIIDRAGGLPDDTGKVIAGGPMMGQAVADLDAPNAKGTSGILILPAKMSERKPTGPCIRCAKCVDACCMGLEPYLLMTLAQNALWEEAKKHSAMSCLECGSCSFICPADRPILDFIKLAKSRIKAMK